MSTESVIVNDTFRCNIKRIHQALFRSIVFIEEDVIGDFPQFKLMTSRHLYIGLSPVFGKCYEWKTYLCKLNTSIYISLYRSTNLWNAEINENHQTYPNNQHHKWDRARVYVNNWKKSTMSKLFRLFVELFMYWNKIISWLFRKLKVVYVNMKDLRLGKQ
jgi:hypothetical protein